MNVYEKLLQVQQKLKAPKNQYNKFGDFHYRSCEDIQEALKPLLVEVKAVLLTGDEVVQIGSRFYIKATATFMDIESQEAVTNTAYAREGEEKPKMDAAQITGSSSSYARKYALNGLFCIDDTKDPDTRNNEVAPAQSATRGHTGKQQGSRTQDKPGKADLDKLKAEAVRTGTDLSKVCERYTVNTIEELTQENYMKAMSVFRKMPTVAVDFYQPDFLGAIEEDVPFR